MKDASADKEKPSQRPTSDPSASKAPSLVQVLNPDASGLPGLLARQQIRSLTRTEPLGRLLSGPSLQDDVMQLKVAQ